jgi:hypothetical protein
MSLEEMSRLMREARNDKDVNGYAADVLKAAGLDGRNRDTWTARNVTQALLDNVREVMIYAPDPAGTEMITSPAGQLCLRPGLCIRKEDCDGLSSLLGALCMCVGFEVRIVKQSWGEDQQQHVLIAVRAEDGSWLKADPSHASMPVGRSVTAHEEHMYDPLDVKGAIGTSGAELVTFGAIPKGRVASTTRPVVAHQINNQLTPRRRAGVGVVWEGDVDLAISTLDPSMTAINAGVAACPGMAATDVSAWNAAYQRWNQIKSDWELDKEGSIAPGPVYGEQIMARIQQSQNDANTYQAKLAQACPSVAPPKPPSLALPSSPGGGGGGGLSGNWVDDVKTAGKYVGFTAAGLVAAYAVFKIVQIAGTAAAVNAAKRAGA